MAKKRFQTGKKDVDTKLFESQVNGTFPQHSVSTLEIQTGLLWNSNPTTLNEFPLNNLQDGQMFFFRFVEKVRIN